MTTRIRRTYQVTDTTLVQHARTMRAHFLDDQAQFAAFDPLFAAPFEADWANAIDLCSDERRDATSRSIIQQHTQQVMESMADCERTFRDLRYFVRLAFPNSPATWEAYGFSEFHSKRKGQLTLIELMQRAFLLASDHSAQLAAVGFDAAAIAGIRTGYEQLQAAKTDQEVEKHGRGSSTVNRVVAHNAVWDMMRQVSKAAKHIFTHDTARANLYALPWPKRKKQAEDSAILQA